jgi:hypothetical protein
VLSSYAFSGHGAHACMAGLYLPSSHSPAHCRVLTRTNFFVAILTSRNSLHLAEYTICQQLRYTSQNGLEEYSNDAPRRAQALATNTVGIKYIYFRREGTKNLGTFHKQYDVLPLHSANDKRTFVLPRTIPVAAEFSFVDREEL